MKTIRALIVLIIVAIGAAVAYAYSGWYDVSVGTGHNAVTEWYLETLRERSIEARAAQIQVPGLDDPAMIEAGSLHYDDGCAGCHGKPGSEPADTFDPPPPALARHAEDPAEAYWIIQNGIKMSAMPIKGRGHSEEEIWSIVAFLQELPELTPGEYKAMVEEAKASGAHDHDHDHGGDPETAGDEAESDASGNGGHEHETPDDPLGILDAFHHALSEGNGDGALALLHDNATILEGGHVQTKSEYASGHLASDMAFIGAVNVETVSRDSQISETQATVTSRQKISGTFQDRDVDHEMLETAALAKTTDGWRIISLVWSAAPGDKPSDGEEGG